MSVFLRPRWRNSRTRLKSPPCVCAERDGSAAHTLQVACSHPERSQATRKLVRATLDSLCQRFEAAVARSHSAWTMKEHMPELMKEARLNVHDMDIIKGVGST